MARWQIPSGPRPWLTLTVAALLALSATQATAWQSEHPVTGRKFAPVMGVGGADWLARAEREQEEHPEAALDSLGLKPGMVVADIGAGVGYFTLRLARRVGPAGLVYANEIQAKMLERLEQALQQHKVTNVETILSTETDPKLPAGKMDLVLLVDVYHEFSEPRIMLRKLRESLKPDGRLVLLEYRKEDPSVPIRFEHKMSVAEVKAELETEGLRLDKVLHHLPRQHILIFRRTSAE